jgi:hypothetical protein
VAEHAACKDRIRSLVGEVIEEAEGEADYGELLQALEERLSSTRPMSAANSARCGRAWSGCATI